MVWRCGSCGAGLPEDSTELVTARFCRHCGAPYFEETGPVAEKEAVQEG
jgi:hypothetical protein